MLIALFLYVSLPSHLGNEEPLDMLKGVLKNGLNKGEQFVETHGRTFMGKLVGRGWNSVELGVVSQH